MPDHYPLRDPGAARREEEVGDLAGVDGHRLGLERRVHVTSRGELVLRPARALGLDVVLVGEDDQHRTLERVEHLVELRA